MNIKTALSTIKLLPKDISVLIRGRHGIGKSQCVYQVAKQFAKDLKVEYEGYVVERRLSQMTEGDILGLPELTANTTSFAPPDWFMECCAKPKLLFLDELNRATHNVQQAAFQIVLDRKLNGHSLHKNTRIFAAINATSDYIINDMDIALLDRFHVIDLDPTAEEWFDWAKKDGKIDELVINFLKNYPAHLESKAYTPGQIYPSRRSWDRLNRSLVESEIVKTPEDSMFYSLCLGFVGSEAAVQFTEFAKNQEKEISAKDLLQKWDTVKGRIDALGPEKWNILNEKIIDYLKDNSITEKQNKNFSEYFKMLPAEHGIHLWTKLTEVLSEKTDTVRLIYKEIWQHIIKFLQEKEASSNTSTPAT